MKLSDSAPIDDPAGVGALLSYPRHCRSFLQPAKPSIGDLANHPFLGRSCSDSWRSIGLQSMIKHKGTSLEDGHRIAESDAFADDLPTWAKPYGE